MRTSAPTPELHRAAMACLRDYVCVGPGEEVLITTDTAADRELIDAIVAASLTIGARASVLTIPQLPLQGLLADPFMPRAVAGATAGCDIWIDLTFPYIAGATVHADAMAQGGFRYLLCSDLDAQGFLRLFGGPHLTAVTEFGARLFDFFLARAGGEARITTPGGTDVRFTLAESHLPEPAHANRPGMFMLPGASTLTPELESVRGTIVLETLFHEYYTPLRDCVRLTVDGRIRDFDGGGVDAALLDKVLRRAGGGEDYGYIIHFAHGYHPTARMTGRCFVEDMRTIGSNAVGMGLPFWVPGGGENHPDAVMSSHSIWIDGEPVVSAGAFVGTPALAEMASSLQPYYR